MKKLYGDDGGDTSSKEGRPPLSMRLSPLEKAVAICSASIASVLVLGTLWLGYSTIQKNIPKLSSTDPQQAFTATLNVDGDQVPDTIDYNILDGDNVPSKYITQGTLQITDAANTLSVVRQKVPLSVVGDSISFKWNGKDYVFHKSGIYSR